MSHLRVWSWYLYCITFAENCEAKYCVRASRTSFVESHYTSGGRILSLTDERSQETKNGSWLIPFKFDGFLRRNWSSSIINSCSPYPLNAANIYSRHKRKLFCSNFTAWVVLLDSELNYSRRRRWIRDYGWTSEELQFADPMPLQDRWHVFDSLSD